MPTIGDLASANAPRFRMHPKCCLRGVGLGDRHQGRVEEAANHSATLSIPARCVLWRASRDVPARRSARDPSAASLRSMRSADSCNSFRRGTDDRHKRSAVQPLRSFTSGCPAVVSESIDQHDVRLNSPRARCENALRRCSAQAGIIRVDSGTPLRQRLPPIPINAGPITNRYNRPSPWLTPQRPLG